MLTIATSVFEGLAFIGDEVGQTLSKLADRRAGVLGWMAHIALLITGRVYGLLWILFGVVVLIDAAFNYRKILSFIPSIYAGSSLAQEKSLSVLHKKLFGSKDSLKDRWMSLAALG